MLLSTKPSEACLIRNPCSTLDTFGPWRIFLGCPFLAYVPLPWESLCSVCLELVCLLQSILLCNIAFFYSFFNLSNIIEKDKKIKYTPKRGREKYFLCIGSTMSLPWIKHILPFVRQALGFNMTLGSCSHYIEMCPPFQKYGEFALPLASWTYANVMLLESHHHSFYCPREVLPNLIWTLCSLSLDLMLVLL